MMQSGVWNYDYKMPKYVLSALVKLKKKKKKKKKTNNNNLLSILRWP